jgi:hypothetical protein
MADFKDVIIRLQENRNDNKEVIDNQTATLSSDIQSQTGELSSTITETTKTQNRSFGQSLALQFKKNNDGLNNIRESFTNNFQSMINSAEEQANAASDQQQAIADEAERNALIVPKDETGEAIDKAAEKSDKKTKGLFGGLLSSMGGMVAGAGLGGGALLAGAGILMGGGGYFLKQLNEMDGKAIRENVVELMSISDDVGGKAEFFLEGGTFVLAMTGIGLGLAAFSAGAAVAAAVEYFSGESAFATTIRANVKELLSIEDDHGGTFDFLAKGGAFGIAMTAIGYGLAAFSIGTGVAAAVEKFSSESEFAKTIRANVKELMGINDDHGGALEFLKDGGGFFIAMTAIGAGLAVFGAGSAVAAASDTFLALDAESIVSNVTTLLGINDLFTGFGDALVEGGTFFVAMTAIAAGLAVFGAGSAVAALTTGAGEFIKPDWAQGIVDNVTTLLGIASMPELLLDTGLFVTAMTGIGAGLLAFSIGKAGASTAEIITQFSGVDFAKTIKDNVTDLLGIMDDPNINVSKAADFTTVMGVISAGLLAFSGAKFVSALANVGTSILNFLSGEESPVQEMLALADNAEELTTASTALDSLAVSLQAISGLQFDGSKINMRKFAEDLSESVPLIEAAIMGGSVDMSWLPTGETRYNGLASPEIDFEAATHRITELRRALGYEVAEKQEMSAEAAASAANMSAINATANNVQTTNVQSKSTYSVASSVHNHEKTVGMMNNINGSRYSITDGEDF